jgi:hypothetical protein
MKAVKPKTSEVMPIAGRQSCVNSTDGDNQLPGPVIPNLLHLASIGHVLKKKNCSTTTAKETFTDALKKRKLTLFIKTFLSTVS